MAKAKVKGRTQKKKSTQLKQEKPVSAKKPTKRKSGLTPEPQVGQAKKPKKNTTETKKVEKVEIPLGEPFTDSKITSSTLTGTLLKIEFIIYNKNRVRFEQHAGKGDKKNHLYGIIEADIRYRDSEFRINRWNDMNRTQKSVVRNFAKGLFKEAQIKWKGENQTTIKDDPKKAKKKSNKDAPAGGRA